MADDREPWWRVTAVFDPDGTGSDFAYTEGLATVGKAELHVWARPTTGEDPGLDWKLSPRDCCRLLNQLAWRLLDGRLAVGDAWVEQYDGGFVEARFSVGEPVTAEAVDAFGAGDAPVLPISWQLWRPPVGPPRPMEPAAAAEAASTYARVAPPAPRRVPSGWELPPEPAWGAEQRFGPRTPLVLARAAQLWSATEDEWQGVFDHVMTAYGYLPVDYARTVARAAAREPGRLDAVERLEAAAAQAMDDFGSRGGRAVLRSMRAWYVDGIEEELGSRAETGWLAARQEVVAVLTTHLVVEAVADVVPDWVVRLGQGLVLAAFAPPGVAPDARWQCGPVVDRAVSDLVARTPVPALVSAAAAWDAVYWQEAGVLPLVVTTWSSAGCSRPVFELLDPARREDADRMLRAQGHGLGTLQIWLTSLATVLAERASLDQQIVELFLQAGRPVRGLEQLVNSPLTTGVA